MEQNQTPPINFSIVGIRTEQYAAITELYREGEEVGFNIEVKYGVSTDDKVIVVNTKCNFMHKGIPFLIIEVANHFQIQPESFAFLIDETIKAVTIPAIFAAHLVLLTVGTTRGALHSKVENTLLSKFIVPSINLSELVKEPVVIYY